VRQAASAGESCENRDRGLEFCRGSLGDRLRTFAQMGYTAASVNGRLLDSVSEKELAEADAILEEYDLLLTIHSGLAKNDQPFGEDTALRRAERIVRWHERNGRIVHSSYDIPRVVTPEGVRVPDFDTISREVPRLLGVFRGTGIRVLLEDLPTNSEDADSLQSWREQEPQPGMLLDLGHMNLRLRRPQQGPLPPISAAVERFIEGIPWQIAELHVHSNDGSKDQHAPPYAPNADLGAAARALRRVGFRGISTIELVPAWCGLAEEEILPACRRSLDYWRELIGAEG